MKNAVLTLTLLLFCLKLITAQNVDESKSFYLLYSDTTVHYCNDLELKKSIFGPRYFIIDSEKVMPSMVMFYKKGSGFYANTRKLTLWGRSNFYARKKKGKINFYEEYSERRNMSHYNTITGAVTSGGTTKVYTYFYHKGFSEIKKATYKNLIVDLSDNPQAVIHLNKYNSQRKAQHTLNTVGVALVVGGFISMIMQDDFDPQDNPRSAIIPFSIMGVGFGCTTTARIFTRTKYKHMKRAIEVYNE